MIIATAGHVDHGKSTLVRRLTGTDPDRWAEEHERGLTIDLGFAWTGLPSGRTVGFVDVPGHRRFVANTLAGCGTVDGVLLAVSAREGWMPQTEEHVDILDLLGAPAGVVALTFADTVDAGTVAAVGAAVAEHLVGTFLEGAPMVTTDAHGTTDRRLRQALDDAVTECPTEADRGRPRLWIDRSFLLDGVGRVVTGTLAGGHLSPGDRVQASDGTRTAPLRIRSIHTYGRPTDVARPGTRVALAVRVEGDAPERGQAVVRAEQWAFGRHLHVALQPVRGNPRPLRTRGSYTLHVGTWSAPARLWQAAGGDPGGPARLHLVAPSGPFALGERFVLRDAGRATIVAGGTILAADPSVVRRSPELLARRREATDAAAAVRPRRLAAAVLAEHGGSAPVAEIMRATGHEQPTATRVSARTVVAVPALRRARRALEERLATEGGVPVPAPGLGHEAARSLQRRGLATERDGVLWAAGADPTDPVEAAAAALEQAVRDGRLGRLFTREEARAGADLQARDLHRLLDRGRLVDVPPFLATRGSFDTLVTTVVDRLDHGPATATELKTALGLTRRHAIPLLEALDRLGVTRRVGDRRVAGGSAPPS